MTCFIILHYMVTEETKRCVSALMEQVEGDKQIVIVDNCSPNGSGCELEAYYRDNEQVIVLLNTENGGFARGNNLGYRFAKEQYHPDFIVIMNNDVEIVQRDFIRRITDIYADEQYDVLGPDIYSTLSDIHQSPKRLTMLTYEEVCWLHKSFAKKQKRFWKVKIRCFFKQFDGLRRLVIGYRSARKRIDYGRKYYNVPLHGSCLIFSRSFIQKKEEAFYEGTFFYYESEILDYQCHRERMKTMYAPSIQVKHHQQAATSAVYTSAIKKAVFANRCQTESLKAFIELMEQDNSGAGQM